MYFLSRVSKRTAFNRQTDKKSAIIGHLREEGAYKWIKQHPYNCIDEHFLKINYVALSNI